MYIAEIGVVACIMIAFIPNIGTLIGGIISIVNTVISFLITYLVCTSLSEVLNNAGAADIADLGTKAWKINLVCTVLGVILRLITLIPTSVFGVLDIILNLLVVIAAVMYLIFLNKGANHLA